MYWEQLTTKTFEENVIGKIDTAIIPIGSVEAHGLHCPLSTDNVVPWHICQALEERYAKKLAIMPSIPYGHTWDLADWPGTINVPASVVSEYIASVGKQAAGWGMRNIIIMNGHGGNIPALSIASEQIAEVGARVVVINWWLDFSRDILTVTSGQGHGGEDETSVMLAVTPELVNMSDANFNPYVPKFRVRAQGIQGKSLRHALTGDSRQATSIKGEKILFLVVARIEEILADLWNDELFIKK